MQMQLSPTNTVHSLGLGEGLSTTGIRVVRVCLCETKS